MVVNAAGAKMDRTPALWPEENNSQVRCATLAGSSPWLPFAAGAGRSERMVPPYVINPAGAAAYHDLTPVRTLAYLRASLRSRIATKFAQHKLGNDDAPM